MVARAAQIGDSVFVFVSVESRVPLAVSNDHQEVTHFVLDSGVWLVSGQVNFLSLSTPEGTMFTAGNISVGSLSFARSRLFEIGRVLVRFDDVPATSSHSPSRRRTGIEVFRAAIELAKNGAPERIRTTNLLIRSQMLYPVELRALYLAKLGCRKDRYCFFYADLLRSSP